MGVALSHVLIIRHGLSTTTYLLDLPPPQLMARLNQALAVLAFRKLLYPLPFTLFSFSYSINS